MPSLERNSADVYDHNQRMPQTIVIDLLVNSQRARALLDSGSSANIISSRLVDQLNVHYTNLDRPIPVQMMVQGSSIQGSKQLDVLNVGSHNYDLILGTPFLWQHQVVIEALPLYGEGVVEVLSSVAEIRVLCKPEDEIELPPLRAVNHRIPVIDPGKVPEALRPLWNQKHNTYQTLACS
ncbi:hypothetical protein L218DRAFT_975941 [Marasmius fiardii PR-910]|nr:hypothetical protein L218DRAFT_975941 [Marasmius fiardii PR-910]